MGRRPVNDVCVGTDVRAAHLSTIPAGPAAAGVAGPAVRRAIWRDTRRDRLRGGGRAGFPGSVWHASRGFVY